jgi:hypothetical protein
LQQGPPGRRQRQRRALDEGGHCLIAELKRQVITKRHAALLDAIYILQLVRHAAARGWLGRAAFAAVRV